MCVSCVAMCVRLCCRIFNLRVPFHSRFSQYGWCDRFNKHGKWINPLRPANAAVMEESTAALGVRALDFVGCQIRDASVRKLAHILKVNTTITRLNLAWNSIGSKGATYISESLIRNTTLTHLDLRWGPTPGHCAVLISCTYAPALSSIIDGYALVFFSSIIDCYYLVFFLLSESFILLSRIFYYQPQRDPGSWCRAVGLFVRCIILCFGFFLRLVHVHKLIILLRRWGCCGT